MKGRPSTLTFETVKRVSNDTTTKSKMTANRWKKHPLFEMWLLDVGKFCLTKLYTKECCNDYF